MTNVILKKSSKIIVDCSHFKTSENTTLFKVEVVSLQKNGQRTADGKEKFEKVIVPYYFTKDLLGKEYSNKSDDEICQEFKGKSLYTTISVADE